MPLMQMLLAALIAAPLALTAAPAAAADEAEQDEEADYEPDLKAGGIMFRQCALCHGQHGQGILGGKYPRIAGMPEYYLMNALRDYQSGARGYDAMIVVGGLRTARETDLMNLAAYVAGQDIDLVVPPPADGDARAGKKLYNNDCQTCHGRAGEGKSRKESPPLRGQYHEYLLRQIEMFKRGEREHAGDPDDETFVDYEAEDLHDILAHVAALDAKAAGAKDVDKGAGKDDDK